MTKDQCAYCKAPMGADGSILHSYPCNGLDRVDINRLQYDALTQEIERLREALQLLRPGLILDLRYADEDDDKEAMLARIKTVEEALGL